jgi:hypothetical protein
MYLNTYSSILLLVANGHICIKCTKAVARLRTPDDGQKRCPKTCRVVIPIKLEFSASVGFIHKESVTIHGHTIIKPPEEASSIKLFRISNFHLLLL